MRRSDYEILYDLPGGEYDGRGVDGIRTRTIRAGDTLEVECYPLVRTTPATREAIRQRRTPPAMARVNARNRAKRFARLTDANFTEADHVITLTWRYPMEDPGMISIRYLQDLYQRDGLPEGMEDAVNDFRNFVARLRRRVARAGGDPAGVRYLGQIEEGRENVTGLPPRYHAHIVLHAPELARDDIEAVWRQAPSHGAVRCERLTLDDGGSLRLGRYLTKHDRGRSRMLRSRNLREPEITVSDRKVSRRRAATVARELTERGAEIMEALYPGWRCESLPVVKYSDIVPGAYIYARLRRAASDPPQLRGGPMSARTQWRGAKEECGHA